MYDGGAERAAPTPRKPRRRRLSRRRFRRRVAGGVLVVALLVVGTRPVLRTLGILSTSRHTQITMAWDVVRISSDRRAVVIRVDECGVTYAGAAVLRVGNDVQLMVSTRKDDDDKIACPTFAHMPTHVVHFGFALQPTGHVLASGCPATECGDDATT
jgi:hypothetical protein